MKNAFLACFLLLSATQALGQNAVVTGTVVDPSGIPYAGGTVQPVFQNVSGGATPTITATGAPLIVPTATTIANNGAFSLSLPANANITPSGTLWGFLICAQASPTTLPDPMLSGSQCFFVPSLTIAAGIQSITSSINAVGVLPLMQPTISWSVGNGGTGLQQQVVTQSILTAGTSVPAGATQIQIPSITIAGLANTSACMASLAGNGATGLPSTWQTGITMTVVVTGNTATLHLINPTSKPITPIGAQVNIKCIL